MPRKYLRPEDATNEGVRQLRAALQHMSSAALARRLACDPSAVRYIAREVRVPGPEMRERFASVLGTPAAAWEEPPARDDAYNSEPAPTRPRR